MSDSQGVDDLPDSFHQLRVALECPVCLALPQETPIYQCKNGHIVCNSCHLHLEKCPQCRGRLGRNRNLFAENFLGAFTKPCPFAKNGCSSKILPAHEENHKKVCDFRELPCLIVMCKRLVPVRGMRDHLGIQHESIINYSSVNGHIAGRLMLKHGIPDERIHSPPSCLSFNSLEFFFMKVTDTTGLRHFWIYGAGTKDQLSRISYRIQFWGNDGKLKLSCREPVVPIDKPSEEVIKDADGLVLSDSTVVKFVKVGVIKYEITILSD